MWRIWWARNNASRWQVGFNSAFKGLNIGIDCNYGTARRQKDTKKLDMASVAKKHTSWLKPEILQMSSPSRYRKLYISTIYPCFLCATYKIKCGTGANILGHDVAIRSVFFLHTPASLSVHNHSCSSSACLMRPLSFSLSVSLFLLIAVVSSSLRKGRQPSSV